MSRRNGSHKGPDALQPSGPDTVCLGQAVEERFLKVCGDWLRTKGEKLPIPAGLDAEMLRWRQMRVRHRCGRCLRGRVILLPGGIVRCADCGGEGDYRNTRGELLATRALAQWTLDRHAELCGQQSETLTWRD